MIIYDPTGKILIFLNRWVFFRTFMFDDDAHNLNTFGTFTYMFACNSSVYELNTK